MLTAAPRSVTDVDRAGQRAPGDPDGIAAAACHPVEGRRGRICDN